MRTWRNWCDQTKKKKFQKRAEDLTQKLNDARADRAKRTVFDNFRFNRLHEKRKRAENDLARERPARIEAEKNLKNLIRENIKKDQQHAIRRAFAKYADVQYKAFSHWKEVCDDHHRNVRRLMMRFIDTYKRKMTKALYKWKQGADKHHTMQLVSMSEELEADNAKLNGHLRNLHGEKKKYED